MKYTKFLFFAFALIFASCDKQADSVEEDLQLFDQSESTAKITDVFATIEEARAFQKTILNRVNQSEDPKAEMQKINQEAGRYIDEKGDIYLNQKDYVEIERSRNSKSRSATIYNSWYSPATDASGVVWYYDGGWHYLAGLASAEVFVTCPTGWDLCNNYNTYHMGFSYNPYIPGCGSNCCRDVYGRFWEGTTMRDNDRWSYDSDPGEYWYARIRDSKATGIFPTRAYVLDDYGCGYGIGCQAGLCPGATCGFYE